MSTAENHRLRSTTCSANLGFRKVSIETCRSQHPFFGHGDLQDHLFCLHQIWDQDFRGPCQAIVRHQEVNIHHIKGIFRPPTQWASHILTNMQNSNSRSSDKFNTYRSPRSQCILYKFRSPTQWTLQIYTIMLAKIGTPNQMLLAQDQVLFLLSENVAFTSNSWQN